MKKLLNIIKNFKVRVISVIILVFILSIVMFVGYKNNKETGIVITDTDVLVDVVTSTLQKKYKTQNVTVLDFNVYSNITTHLLCNVVVNDTECIAYTDLLSGIVEDNYESYMYQEDIMKIYTDIKLKHSDIILESADSYSARLSIKRDRNIKEFIKSNKYLIQGKIVVNKDTDVQEIYKDIVESKLNVTLSIRDTDNNLLKTVTREE